MRCRRRFVPDCLKSAVSKADPYEPDLNRAYAAFARHYGMVVLPARSRKPKDKALVEQTVRLMYQRVYAKLRDRTFSSIDELNAAIRPLVDAHNATRFQLLPYSRRELFDRIERDACRWLAGSRTWGAGARVAIARSDGRGRARAQSGEASYPQCPQDQAPPPPDPHPRLPPPVFDREGRTDNHPNMP